MIAHLSFAAALLLNAGEKIMKIQFDEQNEALPYILFRIKDNFFTISCECISDMQPAPKTVNHLPKVPEFVCGSFQSFGRVITLFDLTMLLGFCNVPAEIPNKTVIILKSSPFKGILVDEILSVVPADQIAPVGIQSFNNRFINGAFSFGAVDRFFWSSMWVICWHMFLHKIRICPKLGKTSQMVLQFAS